MDVVQLLEQLAEIGATVKANDTEVAVSFPEVRRREVEGLGPEIRRLKPDLLRALNDDQSNGTNASTPEPVVHTFEGRSGGDLEQVPVTVAPAKCPPLPRGVRLVRYAPKTPPVVIAPISVVNDVDKFIRSYLRDLRFRLNHPDAYACAPLPEILSKLAEAGLELALEVPVKPTGNGS